MSIGIGIAYTDRRGFRDRCSLTTLVCGTCDPECDTDALLPAENWTPLPDHVATRLRAGEDAEASTLVELVRLPEIAPLDAIHRFDPFDGRHRAEFLGYTQCAGNQRTTTTDHHTGRRLGIHLDNFDRRPLEHRHESRRRIGVNLGPGPRHLLLATQDVTSLARLSPLIEPEPHTDQVRRYVADGARLACIKILLDPGEGYLAPTELIPHDGSTRGLNAPSTIAFWLGTWPRGALPPAT